MCDRIEAKIVRYNPEKNFGFAADIYGEEFFIRRRSLSFVALNDHETDVKFDIDTAGVLREPAVTDEVILLVNEDAPEDGHLKVEAYRWGYMSNYMNKLQRVRNVRSKEIRKAKRRAKRLSQ